MVYDGIRFYLCREYKDKSEIIIDDAILSENHIQLTKKMMDEIKSLIPSDHKLDFEDNEQKLIKGFKEKIRNRGGEIKKYRSELMTVLASMFSITHLNKLSEAIEEIKKSKNELDNKIYESWDNIKGKIEYDKKKSLIEELYTEIAIPMSLIATAKDIDLYGYFYEELSEKESKQEGGEFYTPRHIIKPVIKYVFKNILKWSKKDLEQKKIVDIFVGSGGFLYEYLKYVHKKYNISNDELNAIAENSCYGCDNLGIESAQLNMYLVGDGNVNLSYVPTSINWKKAYVLAKDKLKNDKMSYRQSLNFFLKIYLNEEQLETIKQKKIVDKNYDLTDFAITKILEKEGELNKYDSFDKFLKDNLDIGEDEKEYTLFGDVNLLCTNVPYGPIRNEEGKKYWVYDEYTSRLESNSLRDCIDLLKPSSEKEDGGVGFIIVPSGILETNENIEIRRYLIKNCNLLSIISLPKYTFAPYTTQKTYILIIQKKSEKEIRYFNFENYKQEKDTFIYISDVDGKAQSDKRYEVNLIVQSTFGEEWLHNDFKENFGKYDGVYLSKIERCWDLFNIKQNLSYNQERITTEWNGEEWVKNEGRKWGGFKINSIKKVFYKERTINKSLKDSLNVFLKTNKISFEKFFEDKNNLKRLKDFKIISGKNEKLLFNVSDSKIIEENFKTFFVSSSGQITYLEKKEVYDFNISPESYLLDKKRNEITLEDIKSQLKTL